MSSIKSQSANGFTLKNLKGFRDFLPAEKRRRDFVVKKVIEVFEKFGFEPIETPTLEYADLILGKYGFEADKLVYQFSDRGGRQVALPYDLTVPTARILAQYQNQLILPFRRYQIQNVFRADKPQKGRFREFTQCDVDIFGTTSTVADAEILACAYAVLTQLGFTDITIQINDRQNLFSALAKFTTSQVPVLSIIQSVDKLTKISYEGVVKELINKGLTSDQAQQILSAVQQLPLPENLQLIIDTTVKLGVPGSTLQYLPTLARGLDYYTGAIFEVVIKGDSGGSLAGGGRYDNLIAALSSTNIPAVGISFGLDRIFQKADELQLLPKSVSNIQVLVTVFDKTCLNQSLQTATQLRRQGINVQVYPDIDKLDKQLKFADRCGIPYAVIIGPEEVKSGKIQLKNMQTKTQTEVTLEQLIKQLR